MWWTLGFVVLFYCATPVGATGHDQETNTALDNDRKKAQQHRSAVQRPHILFVVADDLGYNDLGFMQNSVTAINPKGLPTTSPAAGESRTPVLDRLSTESTVLSTYYVQPLCSPTRTTIMTGRYAQHTGIGPDVIVAYQPYGVPARERFLPEYLGAAYSSHAIGKVRIAVQQWISIYYCVDDNVPSTRHLI
mgnify:CR=1 FL=1